MPTSGFKIRFSFQTKVLAPVLTFLVLLPTFTLWIINRQISGQALVEARQTLTTADAVFRNSLDIRARSLVTRFRGVVNEPRFKAVAQLGDARTMAEFLRDSIEEFGGDIELVIYSSRPGAILAGARHNAKVDLETFLQATAPLARDAFEGDISTGTVFAAGRPYSVVSVPVPASDRLSVGGVLTIGLHFGVHALEELKSLTRTDIAVFENNRVSTTTLTHELPDNLLGKPSEAGAISSQRATPRLLSDEHFLTLSGDYDAEAGRPGFRYLLLSSYESRLIALRDTQVILASASLLGILISAGSAWFFIRRITQPLRVLRDSAEAVGHGDFTRRIEQFSNDECGELARAFNGMTGNLLSSRNDLQRTVDTLRATDARLRESEEQLRLTIESARDHMICTLDARGKVLHWNGASERVLGYTTAEAQGLGYAAFFAPEDCAAGVPERLLGVAMTAGREAFEGWRMRRDGSRFWADVTLSRLPDGAGFVEIARDHTVRREAEQTLRTARDAAEAANRAKTEFIANMSHELRTPMNAIIGMSSVLSDEPLPNETRDCIHTIRTSADHLLEIIDGILDISKIEAGHLELNRAPFDLCGCIEDVVDLFAVRCNERNLHLGVHLARDLPGIVVGDRVRLRQILVNLVGNAIKFTEKGGVTLSVAPGKTPAGADQLQFSVTDTGIGIPANRMDRLFKVFSQVDASTTRRFGGTGLGLAISRRLVELMQGTIEVHSEEGRGSRFSFAVALPADLPRMAPEFSGLESRRILVVGAQTIATNAVAEQLLTWGAEVTVTEAWKEPDSSCELVVVASGAWEGRAIVTDETVPMLRLLRPREAGLNPEQRAQADLFIPVKPRALFAATRKLLKLARNVRRPAPKPPAFTAEFAQSHPLRVLLVEDNPVNARVALLILKRLGYAAEWAINGRKALDLFADRAFDVVLMDLQMPEMNGLDATRAILRTLPPSQHPCIIALTANARQEDRDACDAAGMHDFISKPVDLENLAAGLERAHAWRLGRAGDLAPQSERPEKGLVT